LSELHSATKKNSFFLNIIGKLFRFSSLHGRPIIHHIRATEPFTELNDLRNMAMKYIKSFVLVSALSLVSFASFAQSVTATGSTLDDAQAQIAAQAKQAGASYHITEAYAGNQVHMTAELTK
jgi:hypothetical protein